MNDESVTEEETPEEADAAADAAAETAADPRTPDNDNADDGGAADDAGEEEGEGGAPAPDPADAETAPRLLEAILFASAEPLSERALAARLPDGADVKALLGELQASYAGRGVNLVRAGNSWAFRTAVDLGPLLNVETEVSRKLSRAAIETLAIVAYHQPVTRAEIEEIRGVGLSKGTLDVLFEQGWIKPRGRRRTPGRPMTWGTTDGFLDHFGLERITDLPGMDELKAAGLIEKGAALDVYRSRGDLGPEDEEEGAEGGPRTATLPFGPAGDDGLPSVDEDDEAVEPLDPDDGGDDENP